MTRADPPRLTRRALLGALGGVAVGCTVGRTAGERPSSPDAASTPRATGTATAPSPRPSSAQEVARFEPISGETYPNAKRLAGRFVQALTTYDGDTSWREIFNEAARPRDVLFRPAAAARRARPLFVPGAQSRGDIVYPQLGGLATSTGLERCCVMVVVRQTLLDDAGTERTVTRTVDVRLINRDDEWHLEDFAGAGGDDVPRPSTLPEPAVAVLDSDRIELPDSARWDIHAGLIDQRLLRQMHTISEAFPYSVAVLKSGHPIKVFGTDLISGHTLGRGCDIWQIAGRPVVVQSAREDTDAYRFTDELLKQGVPELGSPWDLDGPPVPGQLRPSFTDAVHADHIHVAFKAA